MRAMLNSSITDDSIEKCSYPVNTVKICQVHLTVFLDNGVKQKKWVEEY